MAARRNLSPPVFFTPIEGKFTSVEACSRPVEAIFTVVEAIFAFVEVKFSFVEIMVAPIEGVVAFVETMIMPKKRHIYTPASVGKGKCDVVTCDFVTLRCFHSADDGRGGKIVGIIC